MGVDGREEDWEQVRGKRNAWSKVIISNNCILVY